MSTLISIAEVQSKMEHYCAYQDRCHDEVRQKLYSFLLTKEEREMIIVHLIEHNFLNEERFACSFVRGKHRIKQWGKVRIKLELKARHISNYNIDSAFKEISNEEYSETFHQLAEKYWESLTEKNILKKRKKHCDFLLRKGYESHLVYAKVKDLEQEN